jgi:tRNA pseudouridine38-40 synthase
VVHFDTQAERSERAWMFGSNSRLPASIRVLWCRAVGDEFHARNSARARRYRYRILNRAVPPALQRQWLSWERRPLDAPAMHRAAQALLGEHDFSAFRTVHCQSPHARRNLQEIVVRRIGDAVEVEVQANAFLHHMVRNIMGTLVYIGTGRNEPGWMAEVLAARSRDAAAPTFMPDGLYLARIDYDAKWGLPQEAVHPLPWL